MHVLQLVVGPAKVSLAEGPVRRAGPLGDSPVDSGSGPTVRSPDEEGWTQAFQCWTRLPRVRHAEREPYCAEKQLARAPQVVFWSVPPPIGPWRYVKLRKATAEPCRLRTTDSYAREFSKVLQRMQEGPERAHGTLFRVRRYVG